MPLPSDKARKRGRKSSPSKKTAVRLCLYGDSHLAPIKAALGQELVDMSATTPFYFGAGGPFFRGLHESPDGVTISEFARENAAMVSGRPVDSLTADAFDVFLAIGARLRLDDIVPEILARQANPKKHISHAVEEIVIDRWFDSTRSYRIARFFANAGKQVLFYPAPLLTWDENAGQDPWADAARLPDAAREALFDRLRARAAQDGVTLLLQPSETIFQTAYTMGEFASENMAENSDRVHKSAVFAALQLEQALDNIRDVRTGKPAKAAR